MTFSQIPIDWFSFMTNPSRFITYWGDIYSGTLFECPNYKNGFFIIPNNHLQEFQQLKEEERTPERYRKLGWEINDYRVIIEKYRIEHVQKKEFNTNHGPTIYNPPHASVDMFIFGAGASANCCFGDHKQRYENDNLRSPLGYDIFNERYDVLCKQFEGVKIAIPEFELKGNTIEECLEDDWNRYSKTYFPELVIRHINIQFYLQQLFKGISNHVTENYYRKNLYQLFASQLKTKTVSKPNYLPVVVNFNYDTILDQFLDKTFNYQTIRIEDYIDWQNRSFVHFKPHGSSNWGWKFPKEVVSEYGNNIPAAIYKEKITLAELYYNLLGEYRNMVSEYSFGYEKGNKPISKHSLDKFQIQIVNHEPAYPAMLLPFKEKDEFVMPYHHQRALQNAFNNAERLFVVGWKGSEQLFLEKLEEATKIKEVIIVNPDFEMVKSNLEKHIKTDCTYTHVADFETFIKKEMI
ncbi:MAG: hypothetical protein MUE96_12085 [Bacteroidia bacterium]|jgi:hypothetical protein|nr:hypothetical protein [Bacteroidia bacterium]